MSSRFEKLYSLPSPLYAPSMPVIIVAGSLLKDSQTNKVLAQLKFKSISPKEIKAVTVSLLPLDTANQPLGEKETHQILDLAASRDAEFGQKSPLYFSNNTTRAYRVIVEEIVFSDNTIWKSDGAPLSDFPVQKTAQDILSDTELIKQYKLEYGEQAIYIADTYSDLWRCNCGAINRRDEQSCHSCDMASEKALSFDLKKLKSNCEVRVEQENQEAERIYVARKASNKKRIKIAIISLASITACVIFSYIVVSIVIPTLKYNNAAKLYNAKEYQAAATAFASLDGYKDSANMVLESQYQEAILLFNDRQYDDAIAVFDRIGKYKDSNDMLIESQYQKGLALYQSKQFDSSNEVFLKISNYKDSSALVHKHDYQGVPTKEASCTTSGIMTYSCVLDGCTSSYTENIPSLGHNYTEKIISANSCEKDGESLFTCQRCGNSYSEITKALGHNYSAATCTKPSTCKNCGKTNGAALGHTTTTGVCNRCGANFEKIKTVVATPNDPESTYVSVTTGQTYRITYTVKTQNGPYSGGYELSGLVVSDDYNLNISVSEFRSPTNTITKSVIWKATCSEIEIFSHLNTCYTHTLTIEPVR